MTNDLTVTAKQTQTNAVSPTAVKRKNGGKYVKPIAAAAVVLIIAIAFCAVIGVVFGGYPAAKASRLQPIDALHTT